MNLGVVPNGLNPNATYFNSKGMWITYVLVVGFIHYIILSLPWLSVAWAWTGTNIIHNAVRSPGGALWCPSGGLKLRWVLLSAKHHTSAGWKYLLIGQHQAITGHRSPCNCILMVLHGICKSMRRCKIPHVSSGFLINLFWLSIILNFQSLLWTRSTSFGFSCCSEDAV